MRKIVGILLACLLVFAVMISSMFGLSVSLPFSTAEADTTKSGNLSDIVPNIVIEDPKHFYINQGFGITIAVDPDLDVESFFLRYGEWSLTVPAYENRFRISIPSKGHYTIYVQALLSDGTRTNEGSADVFIESLGPAPAIELTGLPSLEHPHSQLEDLSVTIGSVPNGGFLDISLEYLCDDGSSSWLGYCGVNTAGSVVLFTGEIFDVPGTYCLNVTTSIPCYESSLERYYFIVEETVSRQLPVPDFSSFSRDQTFGDWWCFDFNRILADSDAVEGVFILHIDLCESNEFGERGDCLGKYAVVDGILTIPVSEFSEGYYIVSGYFSALPGYLDSDWSDDYLIHLSDSEYMGPEISLTDRDAIWYDSNNVFTFAPPTEDGEPVYAADSYELRLQDPFGYVIKSASGITECSWTWHCDTDDILTLSVRAQAGEKYTNWSSKEFEVIYRWEDLPLFPSIQSDSTLVPGEPLKLLLSDSFGGEIYDIYVYRDDDPEVNPVIHVSYTVELTGEQPHDQSTDVMIELDTSALTDGIYKVWIHASLPEYGYFPVENYMPDEITIAHAHVMEHTAAVDATCTKDGNTDYWYCSICEKYFADVKGTEIIEEDSWIIKKLSHDLEEYEVHKATCTENGNETYWHCSRCGKFFGDEEGAEEIEENSWVIEALGHDLVHHDAQAPTCTAIGWDAYDTCSRCDYTTYVEKPALGHDLVHHDAQAPTCTAIGWDAYDTCSRCDYTTYVEKPALSHDLVHHEAQAPTCTEIGWDAYDTCSRCDYTTYVEKPALGHDLVHHDAQAPTCTEIGWDAYDTCSRCDYTTYVEKPALSHDLVHHEAQAPTCTAIGWDAYDTCSRCDYTTYVEKPALGHDLVHHEAQAPTCTAIGWDAYDTCSRCDYTTYVEKPALGHDLVHHDAQAPTCTAIGWDAYDTCSRYDYTTYVEKPALGHDLVHHDAQAPICTAIGWDAYDTCSRCDHTTYVEKPALGHDLVHHDAQAPTCTAIGWDAYDTCSRCDYTTYVEKPALGHDLVHHDAQAPTCTAIGWDAYDTCSRCDYTTYVEKPALSHDLVHHEAQAPTCTEIGWDAYDTCSHCDYSTYVEKPALGHDLVHHDTQAPTCTEIGWDAYDTCSRCDYTTYMEKPALGHDLVHQDAQAPTCTEIGWDAYDTCSRCDYITYVELPALGHDLVHHDAQTPTCTEIGWDAYDTCSRCDYTTYVKKPALGHDLVYHDAQAPTCTEIGWDAYDTCSRCDYTTYVEKPALGHDLVHQDAQAPTCTAIGWDAYNTCSRCDYTTYVEKPALGHGLVHHDAQAPTCTEIGWDEYNTCSRCDYTTYVEKPALGHDLVHHDAQAPTCTAIGWDAYDTCSRCDYTTYVEKPALSHDLVHHEAQAPTCTEIGWDAYDTCSHCDYSTYVEKPALGHDPVHHDAQAPTCTEIGWDAYDTCSRCDYTTYVEKAALGHNWNNAEYRWAVDNSTVIATRICKNDASHTQTECVVVNSVILSPTNNTEGSATYTSADFINEGFISQTKFFEIPALKDISVVHLPYMLKTIEDEAFDSLNCEAVIIPDSCISIGSHAFRNCRNLKYIRVPVGIVIAPDAFEGCENVIIDRITK